MNFFLKHKCQGTVAHLLNEIGYRTRANCEWKDVSVGRLISDWTSMSENEKRRIVEQRLRTIQILDEKIEFNLVQFNFGHEITDQQNTYHRALPFCHYAIRVPAERLRAFVLGQKGLVERPIILGEHLRNRRLKLGLRQEDVAGRLGTVWEVNDQWKRDERALLVSGRPGILRFLGCHPIPMETP